MEWKLEVHNLQVQLGHKRVLLDVSKDRMTNSILNRDEKENLFRGAEVKTDLQPLDVFSNKKKRL